MRNAEGFAATPDHLRPGPSETEIAHYALRRAGDEGWERAYADYERNGLAGLLPYFERASARAGSVHEVRGMVHAIDLELGTAWGMRFDPLEVGRTLERERDSEVAELTANRNFDDVKERAEEWRTQITEFVKGDLEAGLTSTETHIAHLLDRLEQKLAPTVRGEIEADLSRSRTARALILGRMLE